MPIGALQRVSRMRHCPYLAGLFNRTPQCCRLGQPSAGAYAFLCNYYCHFSFLLPFRSPSQRRLARLPSQAQPFRVGSLTISRLRLRVAACIVFVPLL